MSRRDPFSQVAKDPAAPWWVKGVGADARAIGTWMCVRMCDPDGLLVGITLDQVADMVCRDMGFESRERAHCRRNVANLIARGLIVQTPEGVRVLWSPTSYRQHAPKLVVLASPKTAPVEAPAAVDVSGVVHTEVSTAVRQSADSQPTVSRQSADSQLELSVGSHSGPGVQKERKRERDKREPPTGVAPQARAPAKRDADRALLKRVVAEECAKGQQPPATFTIRQLGQVLERARFFAAKHGTDLEGMLRRMASEAVAGHRSDGSVAVDWRIIRWSDAPVAPRKSRELAAAPPSPASSFADWTPEKFEAQLRKMREPIPPRKATVLVAM